jgi:bile acid:Na+ symporter, BASS family
VQKVVQESLVGLMAVVLMFSVGLDLTTERVKSVFAHPWTLVRGLVANHLVVPLAAFAFVRSIPLDDGVAIAILLCAAAPGGPIGPYLTQQARGNLPVAVSLVVVTNVLDLALTPLTMALLVGHAGPDVPTAGMAITIFVFMFLPLAVGIRIRSRHAPFALRLLPWVRGITNVAIVVVMALLLVLHGAKARSFDLRTVIAIQALVCVTFVVGAYAVPPGARLACSLTTGIRNLATAFLLAIAWFPDPMVQLGALLYAACMYATALVVTLTSGRRIAQAEARATLVTAAGVVAPTGPDGHSL